MRQKKICRRWAVSTHNAMDLTLSLSQCSRRGDAEREQTVREIKKAVRMWSKYSNIVYTWCGMTLICSTFPSWNVKATRTQSLHGMSAVCILPTNTYAVWPFASTHQYDVSTLCITGIIFWMEFGLWLDALKSAAKYSTKISYSNKNLFWMRTECSCIWTWPDILQLTSFHLAIKLQLFHDFLPQMH